MTQKTPTHNPLEPGRPVLDFDDPAYEAAFEEVRKGAQRFQTFRDQLVPQISEELFLSIITEYEHYTRILSRLFGFSQLAFAADTQDQAAQAQVARVTQFYAEIDNQTMFLACGGKHSIMRTLSVY